MNTNKFLIGGIIGGIVYLLLGWLVWGMLLKDFMASNVGSAGNTMKADADIVWWSLIVGNIFSGLAVSYVLNKSGTKGAGSGAAVGATISLLVAAAYDLIMLGVSNIQNTTAACVDIGVSAVIGGIVGAVIGWYLSLGKKAA